MGRKLMRVPLDFNWPRDKTWGGYLNPHRAAVDCPDCEHSGYSPRARVISDQWYGTAAFDPVAYGAWTFDETHPRIVERARRSVQRSPEFYGTGEAAVRREARRLWGLWSKQWCHHLVQADVDALVAADRLWDFTRTPRTPEQEEIVRKKVAAGENRWLPESNGHAPTALEVNEEALGGMLHDSINHGICVRERCAREGVVLLCARCGGEGRLWHSPEAKERWNKWEPEDPPKGDGYQLWETTSEGSPQSPVFKTLDELAEWCAVNATTFASFQASKEDWKKMLGEDSVCHRDGNMIFI